MTDIETKAEATKENDTEQSEHRHHHSHHKHHSHHHSKHKHNSHGSHHSHHKHNSESSHHSHHKHHSRSSSQKKADKLLADRGWKVSVYNFIKRKSNTRTIEQVPAHRMISRRILFSIIMLGFLLVVCAGMFTDETDEFATISKYAQTEKDQLKNQITILQLEKTELEEKIEALEERIDILTDSVETYFRLYGELPDSER